MIVNEPLHAALEAGEAINDFRFERLDGEKRDESNHGADLKKMLLSVGQLQHVVKEAVLVVPKRAPAEAKIVHGTRNVNEVLEELAGDIFVSGIFFGQFKSDGQHVQAIHAHPACAVGLLKMAPGWQGSGAVENSNVIKPEKSALKNICAVRVLAVDPPGEVQKELVKDPFQESTIRHAAYAALDFVNAPRGPGMDRRIHIAEGPFVGGQLPVWLHVPFAQKKDELLLREIGISQGQWNAMKRQVPRGVPGILPFVRHGNNVVVVEMRPILVAAVPAA